MNDTEKNIHLQLLRAQLAQLKAAHAEPNHPMGKAHIEALSAKIQHKIHQIETFTPHVGPPFDPAKQYGLAHSRLAHDFLDGNTFSGAVGLAPNTNAPFTGTRWHINLLDDAPGGLALYSLSTLGSGGIFHFLDGHTNDSSVGLATTTGLWYTGTRWSVTPARDPATGFTYYHLSCMGIASDPGAHTLLGVRNNTVQLVTALIGPLDGWWIIEL